MESVRRRNARRLRTLGVLVLALGVGNGLSGSANAGGCDKSEEPCIEVVEDRIVIRDNHAIRSILEAERERMHQEALMAELERKRQMEFENEQRRINACTTAIRVAVFAGSFWGPALVVRMAQTGSKLVSVTVTAYNQAKGSFSVKAVWEQHRNALGATGLVLVGGSEYFDVPEWACDQLMN